MEHVGFVVGQHRDPAQLVQFQVKAVERPVNVAHDLSGGCFAAVVGRPRALLQAVRYEAGFRQCAQRVSFLRPQGRRARDGNHGVLQAIDHGRFYDHGGRGVLATEQEQGEQERK